jgi:hypothetical protein
MELSAQHETYIGQLPADFDDLQHKTKYFSLKDGYWIATRREEVPGESRGVL